MTEEEAQAFIAKYTPTEVEALKSKIRSKRYSWVIKDPYPTHKPLSVYEGWNDGFKFAWSLIEEELK